MNETRDLIIGIDFGKEYSQICYYDRKAEEPRSLPVKCRPVFACAQTARHIVRDWKQNILQEKKVDFSLETFLRYQHRTDR